LVSARGRDSGDMRARSSEKFLAMESFLLQGAREIEAIATREVVIDERLDLALL